jgi:hypothetical protein
MRWPFPIPPNEGLHDISPITKDYNHGQEELKIHVTENMEQKVM